MTAKTPIARMFAATCALAFAAVMVLSGCPATTTGPGGKATPKKPGVTKPTGKTVKMATDKKGAADPTTPSKDVKPDNPNTKKVNADKPDAKKDPAKIPPPVKANVKAKTLTR